MTHAFHDYEAGTADWRRSLRRNQRRSFCVIGTFLLIYFCIGLLIDLYIYSGSYPQVSLSQLFWALVTFHLFPMATVIVGCVAIIALWVTFTWSNRLMLLGVEY